MYSHYLHIYGKKDSIKKTEPLPSTVALKYALQQSCQRVLPDIDQDSVIRKMESFLAMLSLLLKLIG